ncbi:hypothetical protein [Hymenobacter terrenus]|uniref:hypothetical protein n=1 Tax=Hymenobacter terrenus TaxID=1629124 RepID=UPI0006196A8D|nr:hypothetical protein [Hymenobacter terrenus]
MHVESAHYYEAVFKDFPFTGMLQTSIPSLGTYYDGLRIPDLLLTTRWRPDAKGNLVGNSRFIRFTFQTDGPSDAELNFPHSALQLKVINQICRFDVTMDVVFGAGVVNKKGGSLMANLGLEKIVKGGIEGNVEGSQEAPGTKTILHANFEGLLNAKERTLEVWGQMTGGASQHRSY